MNKKRKIYAYPEKAIENFDNANFHIKYCLSFIKRYLFGNVLEVGAGCGSFTRNYLNDKIKFLILTEKDKKNIVKLTEKFNKIKNIKIKNYNVNKIKNKFNAVLYLNVLEHIKNDLFEITKATSKLKNNGNLIILVPAHQKMYSNLDKNVGHYRRYNIEFFKQKFNSLKLIDLRYLDSTGYLLYYLNKIFFKKEKFPSKAKILIWDKVFTPVSILTDYILKYKIGKCILAIYKKN